MDDNTFNFDELTEEMIDEAINDTDYDNMIQKEELLVVKNFEMFGETLLETTSEIDVYRRYNELKNCKRNIIRARVFYKEMFGAMFVMKYDVLEIIK